MAKQGPLSGLRVLDLSRLAPGPYCTMLLADLGAEVLSVAGGRAGVAIPELSRGKRFLTLDLKKPGGRAALHELTRQSDIVVEGFRPGAAERIEADYATLSNINPKLIYCSLTGYGQSGARALEAGHDINYLALSGVLGVLGPEDQPPLAPLNLVADFAGGSMVAAIGILAALHERQVSGKGQYIDARMVDGARSLMAMIDPLWRTGALPSAGAGGLFHAPFYRTYACSDGRYVAVGALERPFFLALWSAIGSGPVPDNHMDRRTWPRIESVFAAAFAARPRNVWAEKFIGSDACVTPVLTPDEVATGELAARYGTTGGTPVVPHLSRTPGAAEPYEPSDQAGQILAEIGFGADQIAAAMPDSPPVRTGLGWPPDFPS